MQKKTYSQGTHTKSCLSKPIDWCWNTTWFQRSCHCAKYRKKHIKSWYWVNREPCSIVNNVGKALAKKNVLTLGSKEVHTIYIQTVFLEILNKIAPVKVKVLRFNNNAFMTKSLRKAIMLRSRLKNNFNKKGLIKTGRIIRSKGIFVLNYSTRPKKNVLVILMSRVLMI